MTGYVHATTDMRILNLFSFLFSEAEYAFQIKKKIIPVKLERQYKADGWLGFVIGAKLFFDFSGKYSFESRMEGLVKEICHFLKRAPPEEIIVPHMTNTTSAAQGGVCTTCEILPLIQIFSVQVMENSGECRHVFKFRHL